MFSPEDAERHRNAMMHAEFAPAIATMRAVGATEEEILKVQNRAVRLKQIAPFLRWLSDRQKGLTPEWMNND